MKTIGSRSRSQYAYSITLTYCLKGGLTSSKREQLARVADLVAERTNIMFLYSIREWSAFNWTAICFGMATAMLATCSQYLTAKIGNIGYSGTSWKRCEIGCQLLLFSNRKSHTAFYWCQNWWPRTTLNGVTALFYVLTEIGSFWANYVDVVRPKVRPIVCNKTGAQYGNTWFMTPDRRALVA